MRGRFFGPTRGRRALKDLDQDIQSHIERETQDNIARGMAPEEARRQARLAFGNVALAKEDARRVWVSTWLDDTGERPAHGRRRTGRRHLPSASR
jgi:hypothetical protein